MTTESKPREWDLDLQAPEILAILAGRQTQLRIPMQIQPNGHPTFEFRDDPEWGRVAYWPGESEFDPFDCHCPAGNVGDRVWIKEDFCAKHDTDVGDYGVIAYNAPALDLGREFHPGWQYCATPEVADRPKCEHKQSIEPPEDDAVPGDWWLAPPEGWDGESDYTEVGRWMVLPWEKEFYTRHPACDMPQWMSRIEIEIRRVAIEKLRDISLHEIGRQGIDDSKYRTPLSPTDGATYRYDFADHWNGLNPHDTWSANPHVWVVTFEKIKTTRYRRRPDASTR